MSQIQNSSVSSDAISNKNEINWQVLLDNLTTFITSSMNLIQSLKQAIELSRQKFDEDLSEEEFKKCLELAKTSSPTGVCEPSQEKKDVEKYCVKETYERRVEVEECACETSNTKTGKNKKQLADYSEERMRKLNKLKDELALAQKNLVVIQKQVYKLERECHLDALNTVDGKVNPAALYKEIMKPQYSSTTPTEKENDDKFYSKTTKVTSKRVEYPGKFTEKVSVLSAISATPKYY